MSNGEPVPQSSALSVQREPLLTPRELHAYNVWRGTERAPLAPSLNAKLFNLFLQGKTCEEIRRLNEALTLGDIVAARLAGKWDERRDEHLDRLLNETSLRVQQVTMETADFVCDLLAAANKEHGDRLRRYIQTGDPKELGDFKIDSLQGLGKAIEMLQALTGQSRKQTVEHRGKVEVDVPPSHSRPITAEEAGAALKLLLPRPQG